MKLKKLLVEITVKPWQKIIEQSVIDFIFDHYGFTAKIKVSYLPSKSAHFGYITKPNKSNVFELKYDIGSSIQYSTTSLIHELIHVKQFVENDLEITSEYIKWNGNNFIKLSDYNLIISKKKYDVYTNLPWEKEAYGQSEILSKKYFQSNFFNELKGKDATLDFIINNI